MENYQWKIIENKTLARAERGVYWTILIMLLIICGMLVHDNLDLKDQVYSKHEHQYNIHKGLENEQ